LTQTPPTPIYTLSLHDALPISIARTSRRPVRTPDTPRTIPPYGAPERPGGHDRNRLDVAADHADQAVQYGPVADPQGVVLVLARSEEHTSELQSRENLVCRLLL